MQVLIESKVKYRREWLRSTGQMTGDMPFARGIVKELKPLGQTEIATVDWGNEDIPAKVNVANLTLASDPERV